MTDLILQNIELNKEGKVLDVFKGPIMSVEKAKERLKDIKEFISSQMVQNEDYGKIPGTKKPSIWKPGAEKLIDFFGFSVKFEEMEKIEDWEKPFFYYKHKCILIHPLSNRLIEGFGSCNSR